MADLNPHSLSFVEQVNRFLEFAFSAPQTKAKAELRKALKKDWRTTLKRHVDFEKCAIEALDAMSKADAAALMKSVQARAASNRTPHLEFFLETGARLPPDATARIKAKGAVITVQKSDVNRGELGDPATVGEIRALSRVNTRRR